MRVRGIARVVGCAALWLSLSGGAAFAHGGGGGHGGGGHYTYTYVYIPGVGYVQEADGSSVVMPLELTDAQPTHLEGEMALGDVIAQHTARVLEARLLLEPVSVHGRLIPAGAVLAKVTSVQRGLPTLWCDLADHYGLAVNNLHICFSGPRNSERFDAAWVGEGGGDFLAVAPAYARKPKDLPAPIAYRPATLAERPTVRLGYKWCDGDNVAASPHFSLVAGLPGQPWIAGLAKGCVFGRWQDPADHSKLLVDGAVMDVSPGSSAKTLHFRFGGPVPSAAVLERLRFGSAAPPGTVPPPAGATPTPVNGAQH